MRLLDLFCGAGGAAMGYFRAGFTEIIGIDIKPQPRYPFTFIQADAMRLPVNFQDFQFVHASPPCQAFTALKTAWNAKPHDDLLTPVRERLKASGLPYVIENVPGAPVRSPILLCGTMFGLRTADGKGELRRHRLFESNAVFALTPSCQHSGPVIGVYGGHGQDRRRTVTVVSKGGGHSPSRPSFPAADRNSAMGIDWMTVEELSQAIPPAYTQWIGERILSQ